MIVGEMGASYPQTVNVIRWLPDGDTSDNYPPREQRICEMGRGWRDARGLPAIPADDPKSSGESQTCVGERIDDAKFDVLENHDIYGSDLLFGGAPEIVGIDVAACAKKCLSTKECKAFSFDRWQGACYLKSKIAGAQLHPPSLIGVRVPEDLPDKLRKLPTKFTVNRNRRFFDSGGSVPVAAKDDKACLERCEKQPACIAFNYDKKSLNCKTFTKVGGPYVDDSTDSGYREQYDPKIP